MAMTGCQESLRQSFELGCCLLSACVMAMTDCQESRRSFELGCCLLSACVMAMTDCQESLRRSFELGVQVGIYRHTRDMLSWSKKRRRRIARDELIAHLCGKAVPTTRIRASQSQFAKTPVKSASTSTFGRFASVDSVEPDMQLFHDALAVHGRSAHYN